MNQNFRVLTIFALYSITIAHKWSSIIFFWPEEKFILHFECFQYTQIFRKLKNFKSEHIFTGKPKEVKGSL